MPELALSAPLELEPRRVVRILGYAVDSLTMDEAVARVSAFIRSGRPHQITPLNAAKVMRADTNPELRKILLQSEMVIPEYAIVWAARQLGVPVAAHLGGIMLMKALIGSAAARGFRVFFLGAQPWVISRLVERLRAQHPGLLVAGFRDGYFNPSESSGVVKSIASCRPDILFVAMGTPRQEYWIRENMERLGVMALMGVGGSFDVLAGIRSETPGWMRHGFEWIYRLVQDPRNLWWRYLSTNPQFMYKVLRAKFGMKQ